MSVGHLSPPWSVHYPPRDPLVSASPHQGPAVGTVGIRLTLDGHQYLKWSPIKGIQGSYMKKKHGNLCHLLLKIDHDRFVSRWDDFAGLVVLKQGCAVIMIET